MMCITDIITNQFEDDLFSSYIIKLLEQVTASALKSCQHVFQ